MQRLGEASPSYLKSRTAAAAIAQVQPEARIIAILREPAELHPLTAAADAARPRGDARRPAQGDGPRADHRARASWCVVTQITWNMSSSCAATTPLFPPEQVLVLIYDDFRRDNEATVRTVLRFLEVDDASPIHVMDANPTVSVRSVRTGQSHTQAVWRGTGPRRRR